MISKQDFKILNDYYIKSVEHRNSHKCGGYPFSFGPFLNALPEDLGFKNILEIGTAIGYSAFCFALNNNVSVSTVDFDESHREIAINYWSNFNVENQINFVLGNSEEILGEISNTFDLIFFDGFNPNPNELDNFDRLLESKGVLFTTNLNLGKNSKLYLDGLSELGYSTFRDDDNGFSSRSEDLLERTVKLWQSRDWELSNRSKS